MTECRRLVTAVAVAMAGFVVCTAGMAYVGHVVDSGSAWPTAVAGFVTFVGVAAAAVWLSVEIAWAD